VGRLHNRLGRMAVLRANSPLPAMFLPGQVIWADPAAGSTGPQLLYAAIGAGNLRAYADTDAVGPCRGGQLNQTELVELRS
jgi:hypothetical protein